MQNGETFSTRIVIKFYDHTGINYTSGSDIIETLSRHANALQWKEFITSYPLIQIHKLFTSISTDTLIGWVNKARHLDAKYKSPDLLTYYVVSCPASVHANEVLLKLSALGEVELAYFQSIAINPQGINNKMRPAFLREYLHPSPAGIDAEYAWKINGGKGSSRVKFIDVEQGWILGHDAIDVKTLPLTGINHPDFMDHGAAVLNIIMMKDEGKEGRGITPHVSGSVISQWRPGGEPNDADAVLAAITYLNFGDILLLEMQSFYSLRNNKVWPVEIQDATFQVIRLATALGIIVIEAAGNGDVNAESGNDLDFFLSNKKRVLNPGSSGFKDSGAIIVAAASGDVPHSRIDYSNYGKRINCYAWGEGVVTGNYPASTNGAIHTYTTDFTGTSSASAIIAGVAIAVQSISEIKNNIRLSPLQMRYILSNDQYGTASLNGRSIDKIGVMPDLKKIIDHCLSLPGNPVPGI